MEETYRKARRNLALVTGLLLTSLFVGIESTGKNAIHFFPFRISNTGTLPHLLAVLTLYLMYNMSIAWGILSANSNLHKLEGIDFKVLIAVSGISLTIYSYIQLLPLATEKLDAVVTGLSLTTTLSLVIAAMFGAMVSSISIFMSTVKRLKIVKNKKARRDHLFNQITTQDWMLIYNPARKHARKLINFSASGEIQEGSNENEYSWHIDDGQLVILRKDGSLQNTFIQDERTGTFKSTNDPTADALKRGIKDQVILPASSLSSE